LVRNWNTERRKQTEECSDGYSDLILPNLNTVIPYLIADIVEE
jgi:hypothetical protein